ncbi:DNA-directed RNA polymerase II subunit RPB4-like [Suncus etruscus]|uniref:DNA-directed RNA polymerase II subunit RPB4-like n=1 Tax=Suncus etruscus TaxID=109475 RepID=UPI00210F56C4|nr:DNA-directed RNA polymerase II subunit RPB4-like [Suncus etruscus]
MAAGSCDPCTGNLEDASQVIFPKGFQTAVTLLNPEVLHLLLEHQKLQNESVENEHNFPWSSNKRSTLQPVSVVSQTVASVRPFLLQKKLREFELACLATLCPGTAEESKALIPSLESGLKIRAPTDS